MWEESCETIQVTHRLTSEERKDDGGESDDDFVCVDQDEKVSLLSKHSDSSVSDSPPPISSSAGEVLVRVVASTSDQTRPESVLLESGSQPITIVLSSWGHPFPDHPTGAHDMDSGTYGLLSVESPGYIKRVKALSENFEKASGCSNLEVIRWERPDLKLLYWFSTASEYQTMANQFKEGKMRNTIVNKERYRAVSLKPVRVVDSSLKAFVVMDFPSTINTDIKHSLKPLFDSVAVSRHFLFIPSTTHQSLTLVEEPDSLQTPSVVISLITSIAESATGRKVAHVFSDKESWVKVDIPTSSFTHPEVYRHSKYQQFLPLMSLTAGQAGWSIDDGIRVTLFCGSKFKEMVEFYSLILSTKFVRSEDHVIFSLMEGAGTSLLELVLFDEPSLSVSPLDVVCLNFVTSDMLRLVAEMSRKFVTCDLGGLGKIMWHLKDPLGNKVTIHDKNGLQVLF